MRKGFLLFSTLVFSVLFMSFGVTQEIDEPRYKVGEFLKFRASYSNLVNAGFATIKIEEGNVNGKRAYHMVGRGWSTGVVNVFFKIQDKYETYIDPDTQLPLKFVRNINEGGYTKNKDIYFYHNKQKAVVNDYKKQTNNEYSIPPNIQDLLSSYYKLRNVDFSKIKDGQDINMEVFFDDKVHKFKLKVLGREKLPTDFGTIPTIKLKPYVQSGRVFKAEESVTMWITDDKNHIPVSIRAELAVGSLRLDLDDFKGLKYPAHLKRKGD